MSDEDALGADMHRVLGFLEAGPPAADQDLLEWLLDGQLDPAAAPAGYGRLTRLLGALAAPATPEELAGEGQALAEFAAVMESRPPTLVPRRAAVPSKLFTVKAAAAALVAVLSVGGVALAATGLLPGPAQHAADQAPSTTVASAAGQGVGRPAAADLDRAAYGLCRAWQAGQGADNGSRADSPAFQALAAAAGGADKVAGYCADVNAGGASDHGQGRTPTVGPDATAAARAGLCRAWQAGHGADNGRTDSVAFQALAAAAGGADKVAGYCADVTASGTGAHGHGQGSPPSGPTPSTSVSPPSSGPPPDAGPGGHGQGGPPTTTTG